MEKKGLATFKNNQKLRPFKIQEGGGTGEKNKEKDNQKLVQFGRRVATGVGRTYSTGKQDREKRAFFRGSCSLKMYEIGPCGKNTQGNIGAVAHTEV